MGDAACTAFNSISFRHLKEKQPWQQTSFNESSSEVRRRRTEQVEMLSVLIFRLVYYIFLTGLLLLVCLNHWLSYHVFFQRLKHQVPGRTILHIMHYLLRVRAATVTMNIYNFSLVKQPSKRQKPQQQQNALTVQHMVEHGITLQNI